MNRPKLILLVGIPGSGKSTYARKYIEEHPGTAHLSSDKIRKELYGDESIQEAHNVVFSKMQNRAINALNFGQDVIYDATNVTRKDRAYIISQCPKFAKIEAHIVWAPIETCIERDASRKRTVGKEVIDKMLKRFQPVYFDEGVDDIKVILPDDFNRGAYIDRCLDSMDIPHDNPHHTLNILQHCDEAADYIKDNYDIDEVYVAAEYHDIGKPYTKGFVDTKGNPCETAHYYQHHCVGAWIFYGVAPLRLEVTWLIGNHMEPFFESKYYKNLPPYLKDKIDRLHEADLAAH